MEFNESQSDKLRSVLENIENIVPYNMDSTNLVNVKNMDYKNDDDDDDDDVFGFDESGPKDKFIESDNDEELDEFSEKNILQKRNSNQNLNIQIKKPHQNVQNINKYSCSLPRDIIQNRYFSKIEDAENSDSNEINDNDEYEKCGDMRLAISNLASSIVAKDGRELFGGVPSRRIPINSISQSFF
ncbi:unnamed protein product [Brachionus calyciflorus]|uniref:Uncharacterized protein n=1 Tax=Brachionus calyciflorus TaxID=104777 RepID=A0A813M286_9BILA|nr:unnamed protein product [Brachionus calyciflorus]